MNHGLSSYMIKIIHKIKHGMQFLLAGPFPLIERASLLLGWLSHFFHARPIKRRVNGVLFEFDFSLSLYIKSMYFGWYDATVTNFMENTLRPGDTFIDIGASIGYMTAKGAGLVGKTGEVHSFEPEISCFQKLRKLSNMNRDYRIIVNQYALGEEDREAELHINKEHLGGNFILSNGYQGDSEKIIVRRFDTYAEENKLKNIKLIKIDVEGYEFPVLKGFRNYFEKNSDRPVIICEIFPFAYPRYGATLIEFLECMKQYGYKGYSIHCPKQEIDISNLAKDEGYDVLFKSGDAFS